MAERKEYQPLLGIGGGKQIVGVAHLMRHAAVGMHGTLGRARRAGGIDKDGEIACASAPDHLVPQRFVALLVVAPERHELGQRQHHRVGKAAQALHVEHDDLLQRRTPRTARQDLVELFLVLGEDHFGRGIVDQIFDLHRRVGRIDSGRDAAGAQDAHVGIDPFRHCIGDDRGDVTRPEARRMQAEGDVLGDLQPLAPTGRLPDAEFLFAYRRPVAAGFHGLQKAPRDRVGDRQHCRSGHALLLLCRLPRPPVLQAGLGLEAGLEFSSNSFVTPRS